LRAGCIVPPFTGLGESARDQTSDFPRTVAEFSPQWELAVSSKAKTFQEIIFIPASNLRME
jgi:phage-related minor tail protein